MANPNDEAFLRKYGTYDPQETTVPIRTIKPISLGESPEAVASRQAEEGRKVAGETREDIRLGISQQGADIAARGGGAALRRLMARSGARSKVPRLLLMTRLINDVHNVAEARA